MKKYHPDDDAIALTMRDGTEDCRNGNEDLKMEDLYASNEDDVMQSRKAPGRTPLPHCRTEHSVYDGDGDGNRKPINTSKSSFEVFIKHGYTYVDKTALIYELVRMDGLYFCARPRRFGKSLLLSTPEAIFLGKRELFKGLAIDSLPYDREPNPVVRIDSAKRNVAEWKEKVREAE